MNICMSRSLYLFLFFSFCLFLSCTLSLFLAFSLSLFLACSPRLVLHKLCLCMCVCACKYIRIRQYMYDRSLHVRVVYLPCKSFRVGCIRRYECMIAPVYVERDECKKVERNKHGWANDHAVGESWHRPSNKKSRKTERRAKVRHRTSEESSMLRVRERMRRGRRGTCCQGH